MITFLSYSVFVSPINPLSRSPQKISNLPPPTSHFTKRIGSSRQKSPYHKFIRTHIQGQRGQRGPFTFRSQLYPSLRIVKFTDYLFFQLKPSPAGSKPFPSVFECGQVSHVFKKLLSSTSLANNCLPSSPLWSDS